MRVELVHSPEMDDVPAEPDASAASRSASRLRVELADGSGDSLGRGAARSLVRPDAGDRRRAAPRARRRLPGCGEACVGRPCRAGAAGSASAPVTRLPSPRMHEASAAGGRGHHARAAGCRLGSVPARIQPRRRAASCAPRPGAGFCVYNDLAVAIASVTAEHPGLRVAYVDLDAHHGDGVQEAFYERARCADGLGPRVGGVPVPRQRARRGDRERSGARLRGQRSAAARLRRRLLRARAHRRGRARASRVLARRDRRAARRRLAPRRPAHAPRHDRRRAVLEHARRGRARRRTVRGPHRGDRRRRLRHLLGRAASLGLCACRAARREPPELLPAAWRTLARDASGGVVTPLPGTFGEASPEAPPEAQARALAGTAGVVERLQTNHPLLRPQV